MGHIESWLRYYDAHKDDEMPRIRKAWKVAYKNATEANKQGLKESSTMRSAMSACIVSLRKIGLLPAEPDKWFCTRDKLWIEVDGTIAWRKDVMDILTTRYADLMWTKVTPGEATGGLEHGTPCLEQAKKCHAHLVR